LEGDCEQSLSTYILKFFRSCLPTLDWIQRRSVDAYVEGESRAEITRHPPIRFQMEKSKKMLLSRVSTRHYRLIKRGLLDSSEKIYYSIDSFRQSKPTELGLSCSSVFSASYDFAWLAAAPGAQYSAGLPRDP